MIHQQPPEPSGEGEQLDLDYPCEWRYRVIGMDAERVRLAILAVAGDREHSIHAGNTSSGGRYVSLELVMIVDDEAHRHAVFARLAEHADVRFVL